MWCGSEECELKMKEIRGTKSRCILENAKHIDDKCVVCGNEFEAVRSTKKYCSIDCQNASRREKYANRERVSKDISYKGNLKICPICGKEFYQQGSRGRTEVQSKSLLQCSLLQLH